MALCALLFSKNPETADMLAAVLAEADIRTEISADIFSAIEKGTKQPFPCIIVDWPDQPEASFLLKRARESGVNRSTVAIAVVDDEPPPEQQRDHRLDFLIYRPIAVDEARAVLAKARQKMQLQSAVFSEDLRSATPDINAETDAPQPDDPNLVSITADLPKSGPEPHADLSEPEAGEEDFDKPEAEEIEQPRTWRRINFRTAVAALLLLAATAFLWRSRDAFRYLATSREGTGRVLRESVASLFYVNKSGAQPIGAVMTEAQQDTYFARTPSNAKAQSPNIGLITAEVTVPDGVAPLPRAADFPLPTPELAPKDPTPVRTAHHIPDSIRSSAPIASPVVVTVGPAQMMPVSTPAPGAPSPQLSEPVSISEESARALAIHIVPPVYPAEAMAQKLQGSVVLQAVIGRDGSVQDLKLVRGYFLLGRAAIAAVKQWRFQPYSVNGRPVSIQTVITVNFSYPAS